MGRWDLPVMLGGIPSQAGEVKAPGDFRVPFSKRAEEGLCARAWRHKIRYNDFLLPESRHRWNTGRNPSL